MFSSVKFETPIKLHYSQTGLAAERSKEKFEPPIKLHYSQTMRADLFSTHQF